MLETVPRAFCRCAGILQDSAFTSGIGAASGGGRLRMNQLSERRPTSGSEGVKYDLRERPPPPIERPPWVLGGPYFPTHGGGCVIGQEAPLMYPCTLHPF